MFLSCKCKNTAALTEIWILKDIHNFVNRQLAVGKCKKCNSFVVSLKEERLTDNKVFVDNENDSKKVLSILQREAKRTINRVYPKNSTCLKGWIYGINSQIRNKKGEITQIRQYASDFNQNKKIVKKIFPS